MRRSGQKNTCKHILFSFWMDDILSSSHPEDETAEVSVETVVEAHHPEEVMVIMHHHPTEDIWMMTITEEAAAAVVVEVIQ